MDDFRADVAWAMKGEDEPVTYEQWKAYMEQYRAELAAMPAPAWAEEDLAQAKSLGITDGKRPLDLASRCEVAVMIARSKN